MERYTKRDFDRDFPDDEACLRWIWAMFYPDEKLHCVKCLKQTKHYRVKSRPSFSCSVCGHHVHPMAGRIYEKSTTSLRTWFYATYLMSTTRTGVSAKWLERQIGVTYKTAWRMYKEIRSMLDEGAPPPMGGTVELDETLFGGRPRHRGHKRGWRRDTKTVVMGLQQRGGRVYAEVVPDVKRRTLMPLIERYVEKGATVNTDELMSYHTLAGKGYVHLRVNHRGHEYAVGGAHVNNIESFWGNMKRGIDGAHHRVSPKYLQGYVDEWAYRFNHRHDAMPMFWSMLYHVSA